MRWPHVAGIGIGFTLGAGLLSLTGGGRPSAETGPVLSECDGRLRELVIHYEPSAREVSLPVYRQLLPMLEPDVRVKVVCPEPSAFSELLSTVGRVRCTVQPIIVHHPITTWSRDRWVALAPVKPGGPTTLWSPRGEAAEEIWPARAGDERVGGDIAVSSAGSIVARRSSLYFDGGDFLADSESVFVMPRVVQRNVQSTVANREELIRVLSAGLKKRVALLDEAPDHHAGMFMASVGHRTMLVGDPGLGIGLVSPDLASGADFSADTQHLFDAVASQCEAAGYRVIRIPTVVAPDGRTYFTYVNALIDERSGRRIVYVPAYDRCEKMNLAARSIWEQLGYEVRAVDCTSVYRHFGCLHCLVNVTKRDNYGDTKAAAGILARLLE